MMTNEWRIKHKRICTEHGRPIWYYVLERKEKLLFLWQWRAVATDYYPTSDLSLEERHKRAIETLEKRRAEILEDEASGRHDSIVKEWK